VTRQSLPSIAVAGAALFLLASGARPGAQTTPAARRAGAAGTGWTIPRTVDGQPDLQGIWDYRTLTPLERPPQFAGKEFLTDDEIADDERDAALRAAARGRGPADNPTRTGSPKRKVTR
jgi:hypothetical protein